MTEGISIIIPCYNDGAYLLETIESVRRQTYTNWEVIIVNDGSDDPTTLSLLNKLRVEYKLNVLNIERGGGPSRARNVGIAASNYAFILPLDADDLIAPSYLERAMTFFGGEAKKFLFYGQASQFGISEGVWSLPPFKMPDFAFQNCIYVSAVYPRGLWDEVGGYNENMSFGFEDYDFWIKAIEAGYVPFQQQEMFFFYRIKPSSRSVSLVGREEDAWSQLIENHRTFFSRSDVINEAHRRARVLAQELSEIKGSSIWRLGLGWLFRLEKKLRFLKGKWQGRVFVPPS